jgi:hypothetical protein
MLWPVAEASTRPNRLRITRRRALPWRR